VVADGAGFDAAGFLVDVGDAGFAFQTLPLGWSLPFPGISVSLQLLKMVILNAATRSLLQLKQNRGRLKSG